MSDALKDAEVVIDGKRYQTKELSDSAKIQIENIRFVDTRIEQLNNEWAVADTARIGYTNALNHDLASNLKDEG